MVEVQSAGSLSSGGETKTQVYLVNWGGNLWKYWVPAFQARKLELAHKKHQSAILYANHIKRDASRSQRLNSCVQEAR